MNRKSIGILALAIAVFIALFSSAIFSNPPESPRTCSSFWGKDCDNATTDDASLGCNGTQSGIGYPHVKEVYINASPVFFGDAINVTCRFQEDPPTNYNYEYAWYWNKTDWLMIANWSNSVYSSTINRSIVLKPNSTEGTHIVRCVYSYFNDTATSECANSSTSHDLMYDNDDLNFTVTDHLTYSFWNLTNYTTGINISSGQTFTRNDIVNVSAHWSKQIDSAWIEHNGNGSFVNYSICSNCQRNWTNYTLDLSNRTEFNRYNTTIKAIHVNDTYGLENSTSPELYFYLNPGDPPNVTDVHLGRLGSIFGSSAKSNLFDNNIEVLANVSDDVGISLVKANITYPSNESFNVTMTPEGSFWSFYFNSTFPINETGDYVIRVIAVDIGNQEKSNEMDGISNAVLTAFNNYTLEIEDEKETYMRGENVSIKATGWYEDPVPNVNWTANVTKINETFNFTPQLTIFNYTILPNDPEGNYSIIAHATRDNNTGNLTYPFEFNVSKNLTVNISSSDSTPSKRQQLTIALTVYNARGEPYTNEVIANVSCRNISYQENITYLNFTGSNTSTTCYAPNADSYPFSIVINISDDYNNTGRNYLTLTTEALATSTYSGGGSGGSSTSAKEKPKNCSDGTLYDQCSSKLPYFCSNGTLTPHCSRCGCYNSSYSCQPSGSCALVREEDFNFNLSATKLEIMQGESKEITGVIENTGNTVLRLMSFFNVSGDCCNISLPPSFELKEKEEKAFTILIHAPLSAIAGDYPNTTVSIGVTLFRKDRTLDILVKASPHYNSLRELENELADIENKIQEAKKAGIDTSNVEAMVEKSKTLLQNANSSIASDQIDVLSASLANLITNNQLVVSRLSGLRTQAFLLQNAWLITLFIIMSFTTMYMVPQVLLPLNKKEKELSELKEEEEALVISRVETEKQYFMRKIDENTFSKIMISRQDRILKIRAQIKERENERNQLIKAVSPLAMATWFANGIKGIPQKIKNSPKSILNRKNKNNIDSNGKVQ